MYIKLHFKRLLIPITLLMLLALPTHAQRKKKKDPPAPAMTTPATPPVAVPPPSRPGPKPFKEVITARAKTSKGLFNVHQLDGKYFFEIPDSLFGREIMSVTRFI